MAPKIFFQNSRLYLHKHSLKIQDYSSKNMFIKSRIVAQKIYIENQRLLLQIHDYSLKSTIIGPKIFLKNARVLF